MLPPCHFVILPDTGYRGIHTKRIERSNKAKRPTIFIKQPKINNTTHEKNQRHRSYKNLPLPFLSKFSLKIIMAQNSIKHTTLITFDTEFA